MQGANKIHYVMKIVLIVKIFQKSYIYCEKTWTRARLSACFIALIFENYKRLFLLNFDFD